MAGLEEKPEAKRKPSPVEETRNFQERRRYTRVSYDSMIKRCYNYKTFGYHNYGGRGISVCERWRRSFQDFLDDMGHRPFGHVIERSDVNGNYEPSNCSWIPKALSTRNRRCERVAWIDGESASEHRVRVRRDWRNRNKEHVVDYDANRYLANRDKIISSSKAYYWKNKERVNAKKKEYRARLKMENSKC